VIRLHLTQDLTAGARVALDGDQTRYLLTVMRQPAGAELLVFNGRDGEWRARIAEAGKRAAVLEPLERTREQTPGPDLELLIALVKRTRLETVVEKAAELGARRVRLLTTARTNADHARVDRLRAIATEAAEQTGRLDVPEVTGPDRLLRVLDAWDPARTLIFCDEAGDAPPMLDALYPPRRSGGGGPEGRRGPSTSSGQAPSVGSADSSPAAQGSISAPAAILIGPEGGFDPAERERLRALPFTVPVSLGPRILRADTAAISALTLWQAAQGDWRAPCSATDPVPNNGSGGETDQA
jgi:16S rRNA (uracil1498-N3)-methyltransferase